MDRDSANVLIGYVQSIYWQARVVGNMLYAEEEESELEKEMEAVKATCQRAIDGLKAKRDDQAAIKPEGSKTVSGNTPKGVTIKEPVEQPARYRDRFYSDEEILELFPDGNGSVVNPLLRRAQKAEAEIERLRAELDAYEKDHRAMNVLRSKRYRVTYGRDGHHEAFIVVDIVSECDMAVANDPADAIITAAEGGEGA